MQQDIIEFLRCPLSGEKLSLHIVDQFVRSPLLLEEVRSGYLIAENGGIYPIIDGIPRMLPESFLTYTDNLKNWVPDFHKRMFVIKQKFRQPIKNSFSRNNRIQKTFGFEWGLLR